MLFPQNIYFPFNPATGTCNFFFLWCNYNDKGVPCGYRGFNIFRSLILLILYNLHLCNHFWAISRLTSLKGNKILGEKKNKTRGHVNETVAACGFLSENHVGPCHLLEKSPCSWGETDPNVLPGSNRKRMGLTGMTALKTTSRMSQVHTSCLHTGHYIKTSRHPFNRLWNPELFGEGGKFCSSELKTSKNHWQVQWNTSVYLERELYTFHHNSLDIIHYPWT